MIKKSKNQTEFADQIRQRLKSEKSNVYAYTLLLGNMTGKYAFNEFDYTSINELNIDSFSSENQDLLPELRKHFYEYIMKTNKRKNIFAPVKENKISDLSADVDSDNVLQVFDKVVNGEEIEDYSFKSKQVLNYIVKTIGTYTREDIKENFDFILTDIDQSHQKSLDERRKDYLQTASLSESQRKKISEVETLRQRLLEVDGSKSKDLLNHLNTLGTNLTGKIEELEDIYSKYEMLFREDLVEHLYIPEDDVTVITDYKEMKPQLLHRFLRNPEKFKDSEVKKLKEKIIAERVNKDTSDELTEEEQKRLDKICNRLDVELDPYQINYTVDSKDKMYSDSMGLEWYCSDTTNQISASVFEGNEFIYSRNIGIQGIGFNKETLSPGAIAISSNNYLTTNKGLYNLEYNDEHEFKRLSSPFSELVKSKGNSEVVLFRRGMDFETKASYIFATIDSQNEKATNQIMKEIEEIRKKENLKVLIYDICEIRKSYEMDKKKDDNDYGER